MLNRLEEIAVCIGYIGPFGDSNFGDYAMLINNVLDINTGEKNLIFTYDSINTEEICNYYLKDYDIEYLQIDIEKPEIQYSKEYTVEFNDYPFIPLEMYKKIINRDEIFKKIKEIDKLIVIGGGYFNHLWNAKHRQNKLLSIMSIILKANELGKQIYFLGNTYGPFLKSEEMFRLFFSSLDLAKFATRDNVYSPIWFKTVCDKRLDLLPDDLYFLNDVLKNRSERIIEKKYIILEVYYSMQELEENVQYYKEFVDKIKSKYGLEVIFLPFDVKYGGEYQGKYLSSKIRNLRYFHIQNGRFLKIEDTLNLVKNAEFVICNRYHLFVFSIANNIPVIQILKDVLGNKSYYYTKSKGVLDQVFKNHCYDESLFLAVNVDECFDKVINNLKGIIEQQSRLFNNTIKQFNENIMLNNRKKFLYNIIVTSN